MPRPWSSTGPTKMNWRVCLRQKGMRRYAPSATIPRRTPIVCTALLRQMGAPFVVARANDRMHRRILQMVGAHRIINPEQEFGERFATRLIFRNIIADTPIGDDLHLTEIRAQPQMVGKTLIDLAMPKRFGVIVAAIRRGSPSKLIQPTPDDPLREGDNLVIVSNEAAIARLVKGVK